MWNRTTKVGTALLESVGWTKESREESYKHLWLHRVPELAMYRELVEANLGDQLRRFIDPNVDSGGWDVHLVPQTEWFSDMGVPHSGLAALTDLREWDASDKVHRTDWLGHGSVFCLIVRMSWSWDEKWTWKHPNTFLS